jgi:hypothetical protein
MANNQEMTRILLPALIMIGALVGCTGSDGSSSDPTPSTTPSTSSGSAAQACNGLLGTSGGSSLEALLETDRFIDNSGTLQMESAQQTARALSRESSPSGRGTNHYMCAIQSSDKTFGKTLLISAQWYHLKSGDLDWSTDKQSTVFDLANSGQQTYATPFANTSDASALFHFRCPVGAGKENSTVASLTAYTELVPRSDQQSRREQLTRIANAAAVQLAKEMGCLEESKLPTSLGNLTAA